MSKPETINVTLCVPGVQFGACFYIVATLEVESWGTPETGRGYLADPAGYDAGSGPEWSCTKAVLFHDCGGDGEGVSIGEQLSEALREFVEDKAMRETVEASLSKIAAETE